MNLGGERHYTGIIRDITERKQHEQQLVNSLREKVVLLREVHHRVKNNLQVIISLLNLQAGYVQDQRASSMFRESQNRVRCMATIHETLYRADDLTQINFAAYIQNLGANLQRFYGGARAVQLKYDMQAVFLGMDTGIACGLILHELISNGFKHAYPEGTPGEILVTLRDQPDGSYCLTVEDQGVGLPADLNVDKADSLGLRLVRALTSQLGGRVEYARREHGTKVTLEFMDRHGSEVVP
jgi:two-component sensor histidine kinase